MKIKWLINLCFVALWLVVCFWWLPHLIGSGLFSWLFWIGVAGGIVGLCHEIIQGIRAKRNSQYPHWLIRKIEADLKAVELTKNPTAVDGYKKEILELLKKHNIKPPSDIQQLLIPATSRPRSADTQR